MICFQGGQRARRPAGGDLQGAAAKGLPLRQRPQVSGCVHAAASCRPDAVPQESRLHCCCMSTGVKKGDRVSIYMPMVVELVVAMLACARIGAVHSIVVSLDENWCSASWACKLTTRQDANVCVRVSVCFLCVCVQFAGFSAESLSERIMDSQCSLLITAGQWR